MTSPLQSVGSFKLEHVVYVQGKKSILTDVVEPLLRAHEGGLPKPAFLTTVRNVEAKNRVRAAHIFAIYANPVDSLEVIKFFTTGEHANTEIECGTIDQSTDNLVLFGNTIGEEMKSFDTPFDAEGKACTPDVEWNSRIEDWKKSSDVLDHWRQKVEVADAEALAEKVRLKDLQEKEAQAMQTLRGQRERLEAKLLLFVQALDHHAHEDSESQA